MPRIRCLYVNCVYLDDGFCSAPSVEVDPDEGCRTFTQASDLIEVSEWADDDYEDWDALGFEEEDDLWLDDED